MGDRLPTHKEDLTRLSLNQLCELTGKTFRTVKKKLEEMEPSEKDGRTLYYESKEALRLIYWEPYSGIPKGGADGSPEDPNLLDPVYQRARKERAQANKIEIEVQVLRSELIPSEVVEQTWSAMVAAFRARVLAIPSRAAASVLTRRTPADARDFLKKMIDECLNELAAYDPKQYRHKKAVVPRDEDSSSAAGS